MAIFVLPLIWLGLRMFSEHACRSEERRLSAICGQLRLAGKDDLADGLEKFKPLIREDSETYNDAMAELGFWKG